MDADPLAAAFAPLFTAIETQTETIGRVLEHVKWLGGKLDELHARVCELEVGLELVRLGGRQADAALTEQLDSLDERLTSVHRAALRALNLSTGGSTAA